MSGRGDSFQPSELRGSSTRGGSPKTFDLRKMIEAQERELQSRNTPELQRRRREIDLIPSTSLSDGIAGEKADKLRTSLETLRKKREIIQGSLDKLPNLQDFEDFVQSTKTLNSTITGLNFAHSLHGKHIGTDHVDGEVEAEKILDGILPNITSAYEKTMNKIRKYAEEHQAGRGGQY